MDTELRDKINHELHRSIDEETCISGCLHTVVPGWTLLGIANVVGRSGDCDWWRDKAVEKDPLLDLVRD